MKWSITVKKFLILLFLSFLAIIQGMNSPNLAIAGSGSISIDHNRWIGEGDFFTQENWKHGELFNLPRTSWNVVFGVNALHVNGVFVGYSDIPAGAALMTSDYTSTGDLKMGTGVDTELTIQNATYTLSNAYIGLANTNGYNEYVGEVYINGLGDEYFEFLNAPDAGTATVNLNNGTISSNVTMVGVGSSGVLNAYGTSSIIGELLVGTESDDSFFTGLGKSTGVVNIGENASLNISYLSMGNGYTGSTGTINITNGGSLTTDSAGIDHGTVNVDGYGSTWSNNPQSLSVGGEGGTGILNISNGGLVESRFVYIGNGDTGTVNVDGYGSTLKLPGGDLSIGINNGTGTLNILNSATVTVSHGDTIVDEMGSIAFGDNGGVLTTRGLWYSEESQLSGTGTINTSGIVSDTDIIFDSDHGITQSIPVNDVVINLSQNNTGSLGVGYLGEGSLVITDGVSVASGSGYLGYYSGATGTANVDGAGSTWNIGYSLYVGNIGYDYYDGTGTLDITNGGLVSAYRAHINNSSTVTIDTESSLKVGTSDNNWSGDIRNNGTISLVAGTGVDSGTYAPISYGTMSGSGSVQAFGGIWDESDQIFTVNEVVSDQGTGGATVTFDMTDNQRVLITDSDTDKSVGAAFLGGNESTEINFTATAVSIYDLDLLKDLLTEDEDIFSAWDFSTEGYTVSNDSPVYLSLYADSADDLSSLDIWHLENGAWTEYDAYDLTFDGTYANFTVTSFSGYAVTGASAVPIPGAVWLLGSGLVGILGLRRQTKK